MKAPILPLLLLSLTTIMALGEPRKWPEGPGKPLVQRNCLVCHSAEIIQSQRLSRETWLKEIEKMAGWGSPIPDADRETLADYLFRHYSPQTALPEPEREYFK